IHGFSPFYRIIMSYFNFAVMLLLSIGSSRVILYRDKNDTIKENYIKCFSRKKEYRSTYQKHDPIFV
ncbi:MAG: hypothetical protein FWG32_07655, partial [Oscillospiraceae bacterium]|nr:hypothetical protein [Oscillospiraceae bacterium]